MITPERVRGITKTLVMISTELDSNPAKERKFGVLTYVPDGFKDQIFVEAGKMTAEERTLFYRFSQEKAHRLYAEWLRNPDETFSSWQTRDFDNQKYGGAIACRTLYQGWSCGIISFSGLKEHVDEAVSLNLALSLELITNEEIERIVKCSNNKVFPEMLSKFKNI